MDLDRGSGCHGQTNALGADPPQLVRSATAENASTDAETKIKSRIPLMIASPLGTARVRGNVIRQ